MNDNWLPVKVETHQSWPPKKEETNEKLTKLETEKDWEKKTKYMVIHKIARDKIKPIDIRYVTTHQAT